MMRAIIWVAMGATFLLGCTQKELTDLAKAQECLDAVPSSDPQRANECMQYAANYDSQRANVLKCSIMLTAGGITTARLVSALKIADDPALTNKQADYIALLALTFPDDQIGFANSQIAQRFCNKTEAPGLMFIANMSVLGSQINAAADATGVGDLINPDGTVNDGNVQLAIDNVITACATPPTNCDPTIIAPATIAIGDLYCKTPSSDPLVCSTFTQAVNNSGSNQTILTNNLMCLLKGGAFTPPATCI